MARPTVIVPYAGSLNEWVRRILDSYDVDVDYRFLEDEDSYRRLLRRIWYERKPVVLVEHDILPWYGAIEELFNCMGQWCSCAYRYRGGYGIYHGFGCTKLSTELMVHTPHVWDEPGHWSTLDQRLYFTARGIGQEPHPHRPPVIHLKQSEYAVVSP